jgi:hypothetical protein
MALELSHKSLPANSANMKLDENEVQVSYFVKKRGGKPSRVCVAKLLDISNVGLCMEISDEDSELYMETRGKLFLLNKTIEIQIFCRSYPTNVSLEANLKWIQRKDEPNFDEEGDEIFIGALFRFEDMGQRRDLAELVNLLKTDTVNCPECNAPVSIDAALCFNCGNRTERRRAFLKKIFDNLLIGGRDGLTR